MEPHITTITGIKFHLFNPKVEEIRIEDIAHALAHICRFSGHVTFFYSVAQHSVLLRRNLRTKDRATLLAGLLHDATEAYYGDVIKPLKRILPEYEKAERRGWKCICRKYGINRRLENAVANRTGVIKEMDKILLATERRDLTPLTKDILPEEQCPPLSERIIPWSPHEARMAFIAEFKKLQNL